MTTKMVQYVVTMTENKKTKKKIANILRYPGGKTKLVKEIDRLAPATYKEYREPFLGGASYLLHVAQTQPKTVIKKASDNFYLLYNFWQHVQCCPDTLVDEINSQKVIAKTGTKLYIESAKTLRDENRDLLERAAAYFIQNRITFSGLGLSGGYSQGSYDGRFKENHINAIKDVSKALKNCQIRSASYEDLLFEDGEDVFIFLDPPYDIKSDNLYGNRGSMHKGFDHVKFAEDCKKVSKKHKLLITYNDNEQIRELFKEEDGFKINEVEVGYSMSKGNNKKKIELFITKNY